MCMHGIGMSVYLCSFDVEVCITVEPTGLNGSAFEGPSVGEFVLLVKWVRLVSEPRLTCLLPPLMHCRSELYT